VTAKRDDVLAALRAEDVANHLGLKIAWRGRWGRARSCARTDHSSDAFAFARDGMWHCYSCDEGGDLLKLLAISEGLDVKAEFPKVLELAAAVAGLIDEDDFGGPSKPPPRVRPAPPPIDPIDKRLALARKRAAWVWSRMVERELPSGRLNSDRYLELERGLAPSLVRAREEYSDTPLRISRAEASKGGADLEKLARMFARPGLAVPVRSPIDGALVDIRIRRFESTDDRPKIVGMLGGVSSSQAVGELYGCYGFPHAIESDLVVVVEGLIDYLTALVRWPGADVLGAVEAGSLSLVAAHAARALAEHSDSGRLLIVEHADGFTKQGKPGAGDRAVNEEMNAATKVANSILGPRRLGWLFCGGADGIKDLNDMWLAGIQIEPRFWADLGEAAS
jgi:hypothetical protein